MVYVFAEIEVKDGLFYLYSTKLPGLLHVCKYICVVSKVYYVTAVSFISMVP